MKVVLDANVLGSALIKAGKPQCLFLKLSESKQLIISKAILEEFPDVIEDPKAAKYATDYDVTQFVNELGKAARMTKGHSKFKAVKSDPDDDIIVRAAQDGNANYIVSGDRHLLDLKEFKGIRILTVDEMLSVINNTAVEGTEEQS